MYQMACQQFVILGSFYLIKVTYWLKGKVILLNKQEDFNWIVVFERVLID